MSCTNVVLVLTSYGTYVVLKEAVSLKPALVAASLLLSFTLAVAAVDSKGNDDITHVDVPEDVEIDIVPDPITEKELIEDLKTDYTLTIHYVFADGTPAADDYSDVLPAGAPYDVFSPAIDNYTASTNEIADVMPKRDVRYTVIYFPHATTEDHT